MKTRFGLPATVLEHIVRTAAQFPGIEAITLYGSRAKGTFREGSDIDLCLHGAGLTHNDLNAFSIALDELCLPWIIDLNLFHRIRNDDLRDHILRVGVRIYEREPVGV